MTKILIADDEPNILLLTEMVFKGMGMTVVTAKNGLEAMEKIEKESPDIIITDIIMPEKNGFEICKEIRSNPKYSNTPIILLSALGDDFNKITGFEEGADDYVTKPFNVEELKARVNALLIRYKSRVSEPTVGEEKELDTLVKSVDIETVPTGLKQLDDCLYGGLPRGSNILIVGPLGSGKSSFARNFINEGLRVKDQSLFIALDDNPKHIRNQMQKELEGNNLDFEKNNRLRFIDAYSWNSLTPDEDELYAIKGKLDLNQLSGIIADAGSDIGQSIQQKRGGRRVIDSISSLFVQFSLSEVQQFINQISRTALSFGGVTTLFILEQDTVSLTQLNNIKYVMDGIIEFNLTNNNKQTRIASMKWVKYKNTWSEIG